MRLLFRTKYSCFRLVSLTTTLMAAVVFLSVTKNGYKGLSSFALPYSTSTWKFFISNPSSSSPSSFHASNSSHTSSEPNPEAALYPKFNSPKMQKVVYSLTRDLNAESLRRRGKKRDEKMEKIEIGLARARALIQKALIGEESGLEDSDYIPHGEIYINPRVFHRSYLLMERLFKIFIYEEGEPPLFHHGPFNDIYSLEGILLSSMEKSVQFRTDNPDEAHVYLLPFSVVMIIEYLFDPFIRDKEVLERVIGDYVHIISTKYPYWNRSLGADHLMLSCHDWGPRATWYVHQLYFTSMRALCNANTSEFFNPRKDVSFPEINLQNRSILGLTGGFSLENRTILAFFAGGLHGRIRPSLFQHWMNKDGDIKVYENLPNNISYHEMMKKSKYCLCPSGHEVASPRIVEAIYAECVPVLISQHYVLPFSDVLDWSSFSIEISVGELPNLKSILMGISEDIYRGMQERVKQVQRHFLINDPPKRYDVFHMVIHSIWLRRLNIRIYG